jgi:hypothetical protein
MSTIVNASTIVVNDPDPPVLGDMLRASGNDAIASAAPRVISPQGVTGEAAGEQHGDLSQFLFANDPDTALDNIPSQHMCSIIQEPPFDPVHFDVPNPNGTTIPNVQVYEQSALYRCIATLGTLSGRRNIIHPLHRVPIARNKAWDYVRPVDSALLETLHRERLVLGLLLEDENHLTEDDRVLYQQTMRLCKSR